MKTSIFKLRRKPKSLLLSFIQRYCSRYLNDELYIKIVYYLSTKSKINFSNPLTFNEKLNWLKIYDRQDIYTTMADKLRVKEYVASIIGNEYVVNNIGVYSNWEAIDFSKLPEKFVIKCTHDSGGAFICRDKNSFDYNSVKTIIQRNLLRNYYWWYREWPYKNIKPRIIIDEYLEDLSYKVLLDYKFCCFNGEPRYMYITIKGERVFENYYDMSFQPMNINHGFPRYSPEFKRPLCFDKMKEFAAKLSQGIPFVRVDFFEVNGHIYFGEYTFYDFGGMRPYESDWDMKLGQLLKLPQ